MNDSSLASEERHRIKRAFSRHDSDESLEANPTKKGFYETESVPSNLGDLRRKATLRKSSMKARKVNVNGDSYPEREVQFEEESSSGIDSSELYDTKANNSSEFSLQGLTGNSISLQTPIADRFSTATNTPFKITTHSPGRGIYGV